MPSSIEASQRWKFLPPIGSAAYYVLLGGVAIFILGPLGGVAASYMNFSLGFFVGGQVLAGILGSVVTLGYGPEGKHGANYMQTMAASVASMSAMGVLIQAMVWLGMDVPSTWQLVLYFLCIGMFGIGVGMLYTPILVDRLQLTYPSGLAVANILRALTDPAILRVSVGKLVGGIGGGIVVSKIVELLGGVYGEVQKTAEAAGHKVGRATANGFDLATAFSAATFGGGMIVGARITASAILVATIGLLLTPWLRENGYLGAHDPFRKIGFIFALGTILGAAIIDMSLLAIEAIGRFRAASTGAAAAERPTPVGRLLVWVALWATALCIVATQVMGVPIIWVFFAIGLAFVFLMINGISQGITDQNPISSAFVVSVLIMAGVGLGEPLIGLLAGSILLVSCTVGVDMQQDRSTGWRLGSNRQIQFRYQMVGIIMGAVLAVLMTRVFLEAYPVLKQNLFAHPELSETAAKGWQSAMTFKFVGVLNTLGADNSKTYFVMGLGIVLGLVIQSVRKVLQRSKKYQAWRVASASNKAVDFTLDALIIASPYASSFGGFVGFTTSIWWGLGGIFSSAFNWVGLKRKNASSGSPGEGEVLPEDMSTTSLIGGGLIAGESLFALFIGLLGLIASGALGKILGGG
jgi:uncharacterized oligopeptide transporter (OPT) family protein